MNFYHLLSALRTDKTVATCVKPSWLLIGLLVRKTPNSLPIRDSGKRGPGSDFQLVMPNCFLEGYLDFPPRFDSIRLAETLARTDRSHNSGWAGGVSSVRMLGPGEIAAGWAGKTRQAGC